MFRLLRTSILILAVAISSVGIVPPAPRPAVAAATTWYVATTGNDANSCSSPAQPCKTIQAAVDKVSDGDTVRIAVGIYFDSGTSVVEINKNLTLSGGWSSNFSELTGLSTLDGQQQRNVLTISSCGVSWPISGVVVLQRLIIKNGYSESGGGIYVPCDGPHVSISESNITNNQAGNSCCAGSGGGGGLGIYTNQGVFTITQSTITNNQVLGGFSGSAIFNKGRLTLENTTISDNIGNKAIANLGILIINNSTIVNNNSYGLENKYYTRIQNSILANNSILDCQNWAEFNSDGYNMIRKEFQCRLLSTDFVFLGIDPGLIPIRNNGGLTSTYALLANSLAINAGNPNGCQGHAGLIESDQRGAPRVGRCDIGAYESNLMVSKSVTGDFVPKGVISYSVQLGSVNSQNLSNVLVTDTLPFTLTYVGGSANANNGTVSIVNNSILWSGTVFTSAPTTIVYSAKNNSPNWGEVITNTVVGNWSGFLSDANASFDTFARLYLPLTSRNYCPNFSDDFSQNRGWFTIDSNLRRVELLNGEYRSLSKQSGYLFLYRAPTCPRENYSVEVDARWAQTGSDLGIIFGDNGDYSNFYFFDINTDFQAFILLRYSGGVYTTLAGPAQTGAILPGTQNNRLKVIRNGTAISLYANNILLGTWYDGAIAGLTYVGLATSPYDDAPVSDVRFDNFSVTGNYASGASLPSLEPALTTAVSRPLPASINWQPQLNLKVVEQP